MCSHKSISPAAVVRLLVLIASICLPAIVTAQEEDEVKKGEATISGRVVFADTGKPVRRASVRLFSNLNGTPPKTTAANARGEFRFNQVAAGNYFVIAEPPGGVSLLDMFATEFRVTNDTGVEPTLVSVDGTGAARCEVRVLRSGSIRGTILYSDKEPVTGAAIALFRRQNGVTTSFSSRRIETNDRGMYRIDGLPEGEYFIGVMDSRRRMGEAGLTQSQNIVTSYYPGVVSFTGAKAISVASGSDVSAIDITLGDAELRQISGVVKWRSSGKPVTNASVGLRRMEEPKTEISYEKFLTALTMAPDMNEVTFRTPEIFGMTAIRTASAATDNGEWKFEELPAGKYLLTVFAPLPEKEEPETNEGRRREMTEEEVLESIQSIRTVSRQMELTVADEDLKDVVFEISEGGRISGLVVSEHSEVPQVQLTVYKRGDLTEQMTTTGSRANGTFLLEGLPSGDVWLDVSIPWHQGELYLKSVTLGSRDLMRNPLRVEEGAEVAGVRVTVGQGLATLSGRAVFNEGGELAGGIGVLVVEADPALWHSPSAHVFSLTDPAGEFSLQITPGDYLVFTWAKGNQPVQPVPEYVRANAGSARRITLQSREQKQIELTVVKPKK
jgi:hypothetical protein